MSTSLVSGRADLQSRAPGPKAKAGWKGVRGVPSQLQRQLELGRIALAPCAQVRLCGGAAADVVKGAGELLAGYRGGVLMGVMGSRGGMGGDEACVLGGGQWVRMHPRRPVWIGGEMLAGLAARGARVMGKVVWFTPGSSRMRGTTRGFVAQPALGLGAGNLKWHISDFKRGAGRGICNGRDSICNGL